MAIVIRYIAHMPEPFASILTPANLAVALIAVNFLAFAAFGIDKAKAERGKRRPLGIDLVAAGGVISPSSRSPCAGRGPSKLTAFTRVKPSGRWLIWAPACAGATGRGGGRVADGFGG